MKSKKATPNIKKETNMRKLFTSAALGTAVISWLATASGLNQYVFHTYWQAMVLSGSIQGPLYALSTRGLSLFYRKDFKWQGKLLVILVWISLLLSSSTFSYVSISSAAYSDNVLQTDADQVLRQYCISENYQLLDICNQAQGEYSKVLQNYVNELATTEGGVDFNESEKASLQSYVDSLKEKEEGNQYPELNTLVNTDVIREYLEQFISGMFNEQDLKNIEMTIDGKLKNIRQELDDRTESINKHNDNIKDYNRRSSQYKNTLDPTFLEIQAQLQEERQQKSQEEKISEYLKEIELDLTNCKEFVKFMSSGTESILRAKANELTITMNEDELKTNMMTDIAQEIYVELVNDNTDAKDPRIDKYASFKEAIQGYDQLTEVLNNLQSEINVLLTQEQLIRTDIPSELHKTNIEDEQSASYVSDAKEWQEYWQIRFSNIEKNLEKLPITIQGVDGKKITITLKNIDDEPTTKAEIINIISGYVRMYLTDLNDFEKYWMLFWGMHPHKTLLRFSWIIAVMIDLFSTGTGILLYLYSPEQLILK